MIARDVDAGGVRLRVRDAGEGPALLLIHGLGADHRIWDDTVATFADRHRVIAFDLPGHGESEKPDASYTPRFFARCVRALGRALGVDEPTVVGTSLGGRIALEVAAAHPDWVRAVVLSAPAPVMGGSWAPVGWALPSFAPPALLKWMLPRGIARGFFDTSVPGAARRRALVEEQFARDDFPSFARAVARSVGGIVSGSPPPCGRVRQPVLLLWGEQDRIVPPSGATALRAMLPTARLELLACCGHMPMLEQPDAFHAALGRFLDRLGPAAFAAASAVAAGGL